MNLYTRKQFTKLGILLMAALIISISYIAVNNILVELKEEEETKINLWYQTIQKKSQLIEETQIIFDSLKQEEYKKVLLWREAVEFLTKADARNDITFTVKVIQNNTTVPIILCDASEKIIQTRNLPDQVVNDTMLLAQKLKEMQAAYPPIEVNFQGKVVNKIYFNNSALFFELQDIIGDLTNSYLDEIAQNTLSVPAILTDNSKTQIITTGNPDALRKKYGSLNKALESLKSKGNYTQISPTSTKTNYLFIEESPIIQKLKVYPWIGWGLILLFIAFTYIMFSSYRKSEQDNVWVGMAKETAHQLGTPISSLMAWQELIKDEVSYETYLEIGKDVNRLAQVSERFGKIGSVPDLKEEDIIETLTNSINYYKKRSPKNINLFFTTEIKSMKIKMSKPLMEWVFENIIKNAIDAIHGKEGLIHVSLMEKEGIIHITFEDNGCGIAKKNLKSIFKPGVTTKKRGWGLGLSLAKRIVSEFHKGKIYIEESTPNIGTTLKIELKKFD